MPDELKLEERLKVWSATGMNASIPPGLAGLLAQKLEAADALFATNLRLYVEADRLHRKARNMFLGSTVMFAATAAIIFLSAL